MWKENAAEDFAPEDLGSKTKRIQQNTERWEGSEFKESEAKGLLQEGR